MKKNTLILFLLGGLLPSLFLGLLSGYGRLLVWFFLPGIQGGVLGAVIGYAVGNALVRGEMDKSSFRLRMMMTACLAMVLYGSQALIPAFVMEGWDPFFLPGAILDGHFREVMTGASIYSFSVQHGPLTPGWWVFFQGFDLLFFLFFALLCLGIGLDKKRTGFAPWKPFSIVTAFCVVVLLSTGAAQSFHAGLLRDWQAEYGGGMRYLEFRETWVNAALREDRVRDFLQQTETSKLQQMPQLGVLRALGHARLGELDAASADLESAIESAQAFPGPIRVDMTRKVSVSVFVQYVGNMKTRVDTLSAQDAGSPAMKIPVPQPDDLFPYEGILK